MDVTWADRFLKQTQNPDGGWGYHPGDPSMVEPTGAAMLALSDGFDRPAWARARVWLEQAQHPDGRWGFGLEDPESHWATAWAILALARRHPDTPADLIVSVAKLKTHHWAGVTLSLKNLFGVVPGARYGWPKNILHVNGITPSILGLRASLPPVVSVIDGIVGMEGDGPLFGTPVLHGVLLAGADPLAVDLIGAQIMGFGAEEIEHLAIGTWAGLSQGFHIEVRGAPLEALRRRYQRPPGKG